MQTATDRIVLDTLAHGSRTMTELFAQTGVTMAALRVCLELLVSAGLVVACSHSQTYWLRRKGTMVVRSGEASV